MAGAMLSRRRIMLCNVLLLPSYRVGFVISTTPINHRWYHRVSLSIL